MADERVRGQEISCLQEGKLSLKADEPQIGQIWKRNWNSITLLFSLKELEILHQERSVNVNTMMIEHFRKSGSANKQHNYQSINSSKPAYDHRGQMVTVQGQIIMRLKSRILIVW